MVTISGPRTRSRSKAKATAEKSPETSGPSRYRARVYHEIDNGAGGVVRVEPDMIVVVNGNQIGAYPPELFVETFPDEGDVPDQDTEGKE